MAENTLLHSQQEGQRRIEVHQQGDHRWLEFGDGIIQSIIDTQNPRHLPSTVNRAMLACSLFTEAPREILLLGTGGGALARHLYHCDPSLRGIAMDSSAAVLQLATQYFDFPGEAQGWQTMAGDVRDGLARDNRRYDMMIFDIADPTLTPAWALEANYLTLCRQHLHAEGVLVMNLLCRDEQQLAGALWAIRNGFDRHTVCLSVPMHSNILVFAFNGLPPYRDRVQLELRAKALAGHWHVELPLFLQIMQRDNPVGSGVF